LYLARLTAAARRCAYRSGAHAGLGMAGTVIVIAGRARLSLVLRSL
jgi:hypothetical protein